MLSVDQYLYESQVSKYEKLRNYVIPKKSISFNTYRDCLVIPAKKDNNHLFGVGGAFNGADEYIEESRIMSRGHKISNDYDDFETYFDKPSDTLQKGNAKKIIERAIYCGYLFNHWGHFIVDMSSRLWYAQKHYCERDKYIFVVDEGSSYVPMDKIIDFLYALKLKDDQIIFVSEPIKVTELIIPEQSYVTNMYYSDEYIDLFRCVQNNILCNITEKELNEVPEKVFFSRTKLKKAIRSECGENTIKAFFQSNGYSVYYPELCSLREIVKIFSQAKTIASIEGSTLHNAMFSSHRTRIQVINKTYIINIMQIDIGCFNNIETTYIDCFESFMPCRLGFGPFFYVFSEQIVRFAKDHNMKVPKHDVKKSDIIRYVKRCANSTTFNEYTKKLSLDINSCHYFEPALALRFNEKYLSAYYEIPTIWKSVIGSGKKIAKRIINR